MIFGNEYTGDLSNLLPLLEKIDYGHDNWISGKSKDGQLWFEAKIFAKDSGFGISGGRISKLIIRQSEENVVSYDRGWDVHPTTKEAAEFLKLLLMALDGVCDKNFLV